MAPRSTYYLEYLLPVHQSLNEHLPLKLSSNWLQTSAKRVSDDPQHFIVWHKHFFFGFFPISEISVSRFLIGFGGAGYFWTSKSDSLSYFAPDTHLFSSVRPLGLILRLVGDVQITATQSYRAQTEVISTLRIFANMTQNGCNKGSEGLSSRRSYYPE